MGKSDLIDKINARVKSQLSSLTPRPTAKPRADEKEDRGGDSGEQRITSTRGTVVVRRRPGPGRPENEAPLAGASVESPSSQYSATARSSEGGDEVPAREASVTPAVETRVSEARGPEAAAVEAGTPATVEVPAVEARATTPVEVESRPAEAAAPEGRVAETSPVEARRVETGEPEARPRPVEAVEARSQANGNVAEAAPARPRSETPSPRQNTGNQATLIRGPEPKRPETSGMEGRGRPQDARFQDNRSRDGRGPEPRSYDSRGPDTRGSDSRGQDNRGSDSRGYDSRGPSARPQDGRFQDNRGNDARGSDMRGGPSRGPDTRGPDTRGPDTRGPDNRGSDNRSFDSRGSDRRPMDTRPPARGQDSGPSADYRSGARPSDRGPENAGSAAPARAESVAEVRPTGLSEGGDIDAALAAGADELARVPAREPRSIEDVLAQERGRVPMQRSAQVIGDARPVTSRAPVGRGPQVTVRGERGDRPSQSATVIQGPSFEGGAPRSGGFGAAPSVGAKKPGVAGPTNIKEIANEDRKKEKAVARVAVGGARPLPGRTAAEEEAFARGAKAKKPVVKKKEVLQRRDVSLEGEVQFRKQRKPLGKKDKDKDRVKAKPSVPKAAKRIIRIEGTITVAELSHRMGVKAPAVIKKLMTLGVMATINQAVDHDTASLIAADFGYEVENVAFDEVAMLAEVADTPEQRKPRPPVVTIMGHVDHGKTTLLDAIRQTDVAGKEAGGITQHIGAYKVMTAHGGQVVFLDTPGHEAFTAMRARGAQVTDVVVLVVAADDGVMPQTLEALNHAKAAKVPVLVAVNKIDKPGANPERIMQKLAEYELVPEEWGGQTIYAKVSAKARLGIQELLELILLQAEVLDLKANPDRPARATVIESKLDRGRGPVATVLVNSGTLRVGDLVVVGAQYTKIRAMLDDHGKHVKEAGPSTPVEILGLSDVPDAGEVLAVVADTELAREIAETRAAKAREKSLASNSKVTLEDLFTQMQKSEMRELKLVLKVDVQGSLEALAKAINDLSTDAVKTTILHSGVGNISEGDVMLASASGAVVIGFNVKPDSNATTVAEQQGVELKTYTVIYDALDEMKRAMLGLLRPVQQERVVGHATVKAVFSIPRLGNIAGCILTDGKIHRGAMVRVQRAGKLIWEGKLLSLRRNKDDVREVVQGYECGIGLDGFNDVQEADVIEAYAIDEIAPTL